LGEVVTLARVDWRRKAKRGWRRVVHANGKIGGSCLVVSVELTMYEQQCLSVLYSQCLDLRC
jgi:hypothetical protein